MEDHDRYQEFIIRSRDFFGNDPHYEFTFRGLDGSVYNISSLLDSCVEKEQHPMVKKRLKRMASSFLDDLDGLDTPNLEE